MKIIIFGSNGMLGRYVYKYLSILYEVIPLTRNDYDIISLDKKTLFNIIKKYNSSLIINCINCYNGTQENQIIIHSLFPLMLDTISYELNIPYIHISTNAVFSGIKGQYNENSIPDSQTIYGLTKILGEKLSNATIIRTSIIGESISNKNCLIEWIKQQHNKNVNGFINHKWNGITCLSLVKYIESLIKRNYFPKDIIHLSSNTIYNKYEIISYINDIYNLSINIKPTIDKYSIDLTLNNVTSNTYHFPNLYEQLYDQKLFTHISFKNIGEYHEKSKCRFCNYETTDIFNLGKHYGLAGGFINNIDDISYEKLYPLTLSLCNNCKYMQCKELISSDELFKKHYYYYSSMIPSLVNHFDNLAKWISNNFDKNSIILEMGCNDGVLLKPLLKFGFSNLIGVDPSQTIESLKNTSIHLYNDYFNMEIANNIVNSFGNVDIFISCNSFAHIDNMQEILNSMKHVLNKKTGIAIIEVHDSIQIFENKNFDFIYHEHMGYYTVTSLYNICKNNQLSLTHIEKISNHGGSLRCIISTDYNNPPSQSVIEFINQESLILNESYINNYIFELENWKNILKQKFLFYKKQGYKIYGYGASGRANTIIGYCQLEFNGIIDDATSKIGCYTPLFNTTIYSSDILYNNIEKQCVFILAWPYSSYIINKHKAFLLKGGLFIIPLPEIKEINV